MRRAAARQLSDLHRDLHRLTGPVCDCDSSDSGKGGEDDDDDKDKTDEEDVNRDEGAEEKEEPFEIW